MQKQKDRFDAMHHYNYRVYKNEKDGEIFYTIHETYYNKNNVILAYSENAIIPTADSITSLTEILNQVIKALSKPVLIKEDIFKNAAENYK